MVATGSALFSSLDVGTRTLRNRVWMTAHGTSLDKGPAPAAPAYVAYYRARAAGGVAAMTVPYDAALVAAYDSVVPAVHEHGALFLQQIAHPGKQTDGSISGQPTWSPSAILDSAFRQTPHAMTKADIAVLRAALRVQVETAVRHGLDGVELHAAHGYLLGQFLSPATNHRCDEYGGSAQNRMRFAVELLDIFGEVLPEHLIRGVRINGSDGKLPGGLGNAEWCEIAAALVESGRIDYVSVSHGTYWHTDRANIYASVAQPPGYQLSDTAAVKRAVGTTPVIAVGRILDPQQALAILEAGQADVIGLARALIADPDWANKAARGDAGRIRRCIGDNFCVSSIGRMPITCVLNPSAGREGGLEAAVPEKPARHVAVVGGGPGGMQAALTVAERGGSVCLYEKSDALGGQLRSTALAPSYGEFANAIDWYSAELARAGVKVLTSHPASAAELISAGYDAVVLATGSVGQTDGRSSLRPADWLGRHPVPTHQSMPVATSEQALENASLFPAGRIVVFDDLGDRRMPAVAETLRTRGHPVTVVTPHPMAARSFEHYREHPNLMAHLKGLGVQFECGYDLTEISTSQVSFADVHTAAKLEVQPVSGVVLIIGNQAVDGLFADLEQAGVPVFAVGDCVAPRGLAEAIREAELVGRRV